MSVSDDDDTSTAILAQVAYELALFSILLMHAVILAMVAAYGWCFKAQPIVSVVQSTMRSLSLAWTLLQYILRWVLHSTLRNLTSAWTLSQYTQKLMPHPSPLEMVACIIMVDANITEGPYVQTALATFILLLVVWEWHVSLIMPHRICL